jgi:hypothetical protein
MKISLEGTNEECEELTGQISNLFYTSIISDFRIIEGNIGRMELETLLERVSAAHARGVGLCLNDPSHGRSEIRGLCRACYDQWRKNFSQNRCSLPGCIKGHYAHDYCKKHYYSWKKHGDPLHVENKAKQTCIEPGCAEAVYSKARCRSHYRKHKTKDV